MTGRQTEVLASMARDVQWAMDALHANEHYSAERILARAWETYVAYRDGEASRLDERERRV